MYRARSCHLYLEDNGVQILSTLRSLTINGLRLDGIWSITEGIAALVQDIKGLLSLLGLCEPAAEDQPSGRLLIGPDISLATSGLGYS